MKKQVKKFDTDALITESERKQRKGMEEGSAALLHVLMCEHPRILRHLRKKIGITL